MSKRLPYGFRQRKSGGLEYRFRINHVRYSVYGKTTDDCREKERLLREEIAKGTYKSNRDITLSDYFEEWLRMKAGSVQEATIIHNQSTYKRIGAALGKMRIRDIEKRQVNQFRDSLEAEIRNDDSRLWTHGGNDILELLKSILNAAVNDGIIDRNPAAGIKRFKRTEEEARDTTHRRLSPEELERFFAAAKESFYLCLFEFMLATGMRVGECLGLYWTDIDFKSDTINIRRSVTKAKNEEGKTIIIVGESAKTAAGRRSIPMNDEIRRILKKQKEMTELCFGAKVSDLVFPSTTGKVGRPSSVDTIMKGITKAAGIEHFTAHAFRHTFASNMVDAGVAPEVLKNILGHANIKITLDTYYHVSGDRMREAMGNVVSFRKVV